MNFLNIKWLNVLDNFELSIKTTRNLCVRNKRKAGQPR